MDTPSFETKVREHAYRAYILAQIETLPPGYTTTAWACVLMDNSYDKLLARYRKRVAKATAEAEAANASDLLFLEYTLPAVPPVELAAKSAALFKTWAREQAEQECSKVLHRFTGQGRSPEVLRAAAAAVQRRLDDLVFEQNFPRFTGKLKINAQGSFLLTLFNPRGR